MRRLALLLVLLACAGCGLGSSLPYRAWRLGFLTPNNMEVWIETADVEDVNGRIFFRAGSGIAATPTSRKSADWSPIISVGAGRDVVGAALPRHIYVRWQSLVEPQTYRVTLDIPERARELMLQKPTPDARWYNDAVAIGLAPGGIVKVWITGASSKPVEVMCVQAEVEPLGPYEGKSDGKHRPLTERAKPYVEQHGVPYGSWDCGSPKAASHEAH